MALPLLVAPRAPWQVIVEWSASHRFGDLWNPDEQTGQLALGFGYRISPGWTLHAMAAVGVLGGIGQPQHRVLASTAYRPAAAPTVPDAALTSEQPRPAIEPEAPPPAPDATTTPSSEASVAPPPSAATPVQPPPQPAASQPEANTALPPTAARPPAPVFETLTGEDRVREMRHSLGQRIYLVDAGTGFDEESTAQLDRLLAVLDASPGLYIRIEGHGVPGGDSVASRALALRRAQAVQQYLMAHSRDARGLAMRISTVSRLEEGPPDAHDTEAGHGYSGYVSFSVFGRGP